MAKPPVVDIWKVDFRVQKINGAPFHQPSEMIRSTREEISKTLQFGAEKLADRYDFALVEVTAKSVNTGEEVKYTHRTESGHYGNWPVGQ